MKTITALSPLLVLALAGCALTGCALTGGGGADGSGTGGSGAGDSDSSGAESGTSGSGGSTGCIIDKDWQLDVADGATQLGDLLASKGLTVVSSVGEGEQGIYFDQEGVAGSATNLTYTISIDMGDGISMVMVQHHEGSPGGNWAWDGDAPSTIVYDGWSGGYTVTTTTSINGTAAPSSVTPQGSGLDGLAMTVDCDGDTMTTQTEGSPFTQLWHAN